MFCDEALDAIEAIAAGDLVPEGRVAAHLRTCANCAAALADAQLVERMLSTRAAPAPPAPFVTRTMARIRRERWRSEQVVDAGFNVAVVVVVAGVLSVIWLLMHQSGLGGVSRDAVDLFGVGVSALAHRVAPQVPLYAGATALLATALGLWWWAERDAPL
jgi:predicted anti-sigma-YlaC factor YlaD